MLHLQHYLTEHMEHWEMRGDLTENQQVKHWAVLS